MPCCCRTACFHDQVSSLREEHAFPLRVWVRETASGGPHHHEPHREHRNNDASGKATYNPDDKRDHFLTALRAATASGSKNDTVGAPGVAGTVAGSATVPDVITEGSESPTELVSVSVML